MFREYFKPLTLAECIEIADYYGENSRFLAGGTDLVLKMRAGTIKLKAVIDLSYIPQLAQIVEREQELVIGSMCRLTDVSRSIQISKNAEVICIGAGHVSSIQVRNMATIGGNSCNASPSADTVPCLIVSEAVALIEGPKGKRALPLETLFIGPGKTQLEKGEVLTAFKIPIEKEFTGSAYEKYSIRGDTDIAIVGVASRIVIDKDGIVKKARLAMAAVAPRPIRAEDVEKMLIGKKLTNSLIEEAANKASQIISPISDQRASKEYRIEMIKVHTRKVLSRSYKEAISFLK